MKKVMIFTLALMLTSCKLLKSSTSETPIYYKVECPDGNVHEVRAIGQGYAIDFATGKTTIFLNDSYKVTPIYSLNKSN